jgi:hypothetical protein
MRPAPLARLLPCGGGRGNRSLSYERWPTLAAFGDKSNRAFSRRNGDRDSLLDADARGFASVIAFPEAIQRRAARQSSAVT